MLMRSICFAILIGAISFLKLNADGQAISAGAQSSPQASFDVVSIRPMTEDDNTPTHITNSTRNGYIKAVNVNLKALLEVAYDLPDLRMFGGPTWLSTEKFSLEAKADPKVDEQIASLSSEQAKQFKRKMLMALLTERFKVAVHTKAREMPVYNLVIAKGGPKFGGNKLGGEPIPQGNDRVEIRAGSSDSLEVLAYELSWRLGRPVINRTGLQCRQAVMLRWQDDDGTTADSNGPSLFTAVQEQLGLKLESARGAVRVLLIDHADKPAEN